jgi:hypothetical protein
MTTKRVATKGTSLEETAIMFNDEGVEIVDWHEGDLGPVTMIRFNGDEEAGFKAVEVAKAIGLWPIDLHRVWYHRYGGEKHPHWQLTFNYPPEEGQVDEATLSLMVESLSYTPLYRTSPQGTNSLHP